MLASRLVFVGTVGTIPQKLDKLSETHQKEQKPGDYVVVVGGKLVQMGFTVLHLAH